MDRDFIVNVLKNISAIMIENREYLIELDSVIGDGDLGLTMSDGFSAAFSAAADSNEPDVGKLLYRSGKAMAGAVPSTMGTLMASGLMNAGKALKGETELSDSTIVEMFDAFGAGVSDRGGAKPGEKTFLDGWAPAVETMKASLHSGENLIIMSEKAFHSSKKGYEDTHGMLAKHGRAAGRGERSRDFKDPGAKVATFIFKGFLKTVADTVKE